MQNNSERGNDLKTFGLLIVFCTCSAAGVLKSFEYTEAQKELYAFILFLKFIKREVEVYLTRQKDIFERFENKLLENSGFLPTLRSREISDDKSPLYHVLREWDKRLRIPDEAKNLLVEFSESFGQTSPSEQSAKCDITLAALEEIYKKCKEENSSRIRLCRSAGCIVGAFAVLLLI